MHVMITGASKGIGLAIAKRFAREGNESLSLCARDERTLLIAPQTIEKEFPNVQIFAKKCDVALEPDVKHFASEAIQTFGPVDLLVNNAGFGLFKNVSDMSVEEFDGVMNTNLRGIFLMTQVVLPEMIKRRSGTIVAISSLAGRNGFAGGAAYCASKFGVRGLMQSLFLEVRDFDIRTITVFPGSVDTDFFDTAGQPLGSRASTALRAEDVAAAVYAAVMLPTSATISELDIRPTNPKKNISTI
jgi:NADP-dependent 3-hydroxy acid dehydrogenase YdfG